MNHQAEHIHAYLSGLMTHDEKIAFEKQLDEDQALNEYYIVCKELYASFNENDWNALSLQDFKEEVEEYAAYYKSDTAQKLKQTISEAENTYFETAPKKRNTLLYKVIAAAAILCGVYLGYILTNTSSNADLYKQYKNFEDIPSLTLRGENDALLVKGEQLFKEGKYSEAISYFENWLQKNPTSANTTVLLYLGVSHLEIENTSEAIDYFTRVSTSDSLDVLRAKWYLALAYLKNKEIEKAKAQLTIITQTITNPNYNKAKELIEKL